VKITEERVRYVADLANLALTDEEVGRMVKDLDDILNYIDKLNELDTEGVEPLAQVLADSGPFTTLREDAEGGSFSNETALANAPMAGSGHFKVPKVIER
jgi:aspartyl-tRNA(Asn)/glutamyl-tRNA(Gln) amidotransferase subunit C